MILPNQNENGFHVMQDDKIIKFVPCTREQWESVECIDYIDLADLENFMDSWGTSFTTRVLDMAIERGL